MTNYEKRRSAGRYCRYALRCLWRDERGGTAVEYVLLAALISVAVILAMDTLGGSVDNTMNNVNQGMASR